ncbi:uncharacterized protein LOC123469833 [Daphnia magna]|uniref:uncharacterized protein LOC123469833 n=1 Tax=Daphnia magna TaxID=35525 RepID=UPI001E1BA33B|nr:uncharacterized protein LOC123469833 [Daphnia magna]
MSILDSLTEATTFDSHADIVIFIERLFQEGIVYLRRGDTKSVKSYNKDPRNKVIIDEEVEFKSVQYICPHFGTHNSRAKKGRRLNQHVMPNYCPVQIRFSYNPDESVKKFKITKLELFHHTHPVSEAHLHTYARKKHMTTEAFDFAKSALVAGGQPTKVRKLLLDKFGSHLISKDIINLKQTLTGKPINNEVAITKVTFTDKDCAEIAALGKTFTKAVHLLCQFHGLKAVDFHLTRTKNGEIEREKHHEIRQNFRAAMYAETPDACDKAKAYLIGPGLGSLGEYFADNWFNIEDKWTNLGRRNLPTFGNNTTNRIERFHHTIKDVLQKTKRLSEVIQTLVNVTLLRLSDRELKQKIREVRFSTPSKPELIRKFAESISPFAWNLLENEIKIMRKNYHFILDNDYLTYTIMSRNTNYKLKKDLSSCSCHFYSAFGLPCRHIIYFHFKDNLEIPSGSYAEHWRNECLEVTIEVNEPNIVYINNNVLMVLE